MRRSKVYGLPVLLSAGVGVGSERGAGREGLHGETVLHVDNDGLHGDGGGVLDGLNGQRSCSGFFDDLRLDSGLLGACATTDQSESTSADAATDAAEKGEASEETADGADGAADENAESGHASATESDPFLQIFLAVLSKTSANEAFGREEIMRRNVVGKVRADGDTVIVARFIERSALSTRLHVVLLLLIVIIIVIVTGGGGFIVTSNLTGLLGFFGLLRLGAVMVGYPVAPIGDHLLARVAHASRVGLEAFRFENSGNLSWVLRRIEVGAKALLVVGAITLITIHESLVMRSALTVAGAAAMSVGGNAHKQYGSQDYKQECLGHFVFC